jgi:hypothetical protein
MINTANISNALTKLSSAEAVEYFAPVFELLAELPASCDVPTISRTICGELEDTTAAEFLSSLLTIEGGTENEIEGVEFTTDEINDAVALFHDICTRYPAIMELAHNR